MIGSDNTFSRRLLAWYDHAKRTLPWRTTSTADAPAYPPAYYVLLSEFMLQQTQVATVIPYFHRFIESFPTLGDLARSPQDRVLKLWQGLGYYSRARNLLACARAIVDQHGGIVPGDVPTLLKLPGIGRYTAGAISSLAYNRRSPIVDGNVIRVICRLDAIQVDPQAKEISALLWARAEGMLPGDRPGDFNSALMELGATVCVPRSPACLLCPVKMHCQALESNLVDQIPVKKKAKTIPMVQRLVFCINNKDKFLIEQRPTKGRWAGLWQFKTIDPVNEFNSRNVRLAKALLLQAGYQVRHVRNLANLTHLLTHRRYEFAAYSAEFVAVIGASANVEPLNQRWVTLSQLDDFALSKPQLEIAKLLSAGVKQ